MTQQQPRTGHPYHMYDAIQRQPQAMAEMLTKHAERVTEVRNGRTKCGMGDLSLRLSGE